MLPVPPYPHTFTFTFTTLSFLFPQVIPSKDVKVSGLLGPAARMEKKSSHVADSEVGQGGTTQWKMCSVGYDSAAAVFFEITATRSVP